MKSPMTWVSNFRPVFTTNRFVNALAIMGLGIGLGAAITAASSMIMLSAPPDRAGMAASLEVSLL